MKGHHDIATVPLEGSTFTLRVPATTGEQVGVSAYLTKPYRDGEPLNRVRDLLAA